MGKEERNSSRTLEVAAAAAVVVVELAEMQGWSLPLHMRSEGCSA